MVREQTTAVSSWVRRNSEALWGLGADAKERMAELPDDCLDALRAARDRFSVTEAYETIITGVREGAAPAAITARVAAIPKALADMPTNVTHRLWRGGFSPKTLYDLVPDGVKTNAEAVARFLERRDLSHIESIKNAPARRRDIANVVFERVSWNRARGGEHMTPRELVRVRLDNFAEGVVEASKATTKGAAKGAVIGALLELPVTTVEHFLLVKRERKTPTEAAIDAAKAVGKSAAGGAAGAVVFAGVALTGVSVAPAATPLVIIGGVVYVWSATERIWRAARPADEQPDAMLADAVQEGWLTPASSPGSEPPRGGPPVATLSELLEELDEDRSR